MELEILRACIMLIRICRYYNLQLCCGVGVCWCPECYFPCGCIWFNLEHIDHLYWCEIPQAHKLCALYIFTDKSRVRRIIWDWLNKKRVMRKKIFGLLVLVDLFKCNRHPVGSEHPVFFDPLFIGRWASKFCHISALTLVQFGGSCSCIEFIFCAVAVNQKKIKIISKYVGCQMLSLLLDSQFVHVRLLCRWWRKWATSMHQQQPKTYR